MEPLVLDIDMELEWEFEHGDTLADISSPSDDVGNLLEDNLLLPKGWRVEITSDHDLHVDQFSKSRHGSFKVTSDNGVPAYTGNWSIDAKLREDYDWGKGYDDDEDWVLGSITVDTLELEEDGVEAGIVMEKKGSGQPLMMRRDYGAPTEGRLGMDREKAERLIEEVMEKDASMGREAITLEPKTVLVKMKNKMAVNYVEGVYVHPSLMTKVDKVVVYATGSVKQAPTMAPKPVAEMAKGEGEEETAE